MQKQPSTELHVARAAVGTAAAGDSIYSDSPLNNHPQSHNPIKVIQAQPADGIRYRGLPGGEGVAYDPESLDAGNSDPYHPKAKASASTSAPAKDEWVRGDPGPFGLLCFGMTTCMLMFITTEWAEDKFIHMMMMYAMFYGGFGQFVAGVLELIKGNTFGGTAFCSYGCFWMGWFLLEYSVTWNRELWGGPYVVGKTLWCGLWAVLTAGFFVVTLNKNGCLQTIFSTLVITFSLLAAGQHDETAEQAAGYIGFFCGSSAIYAAFAFLYKAELGIALPGVKATKYIVARQ